MDLLGKGRLGDVQARGGVGEVQLLGGGHEVFEVTELHGRAEGERGNDPRAVLGEGRRGELRLLIRSFPFDARTICSVSMATAPSHPLAATPGKTRNGRREHRHDGEERVSPTGKAGATRPFRYGRTGRTGTTNGQDGRSAARRGALDPPSLASPFPRAPMDDHNFSRKSLMFFSDLSLGLGFVSIAISIFAWLKGQGWRICPP